MNRAKWIFYLMLASMLSLGMLHAQKPVGLNRPAVVPSDYVVTPAGYFHPSCVRMVPDGGTLLPDGRLQFKDGTQETVASSCSFPHYTARGEMVSPNSDDIKPPYIDWSWIEAGQVSSTNIYNGVGATWPVPQTPTTNDSQTLYFFPGLMPLAGNLIIQPVLGFDDGQEGVGPWNIASWNCCPAGMTWYSTPLTVAPGDQIAGSIMSTCGNALLQLCPKWAIKTTDMTTQLSTTLNVVFPGMTNFKWAQSGVLEVYSIYQCSDYPPDGSITFSNVVLYDNLYRRVPHPGWSPMYWVTQGQTNPWCNYSAATTDTTATLTY